MSTKLSGLASLSFIRGTRLCPPAKTFESLIFFSMDIAFDTVVGIWSSKARGIMPVLLGRRKSRYVFSADFRASGSLRDDLVPERPSDPLGGDLDDVAHPQEPLGLQVPV